MSNHLPLKVSRSEAGEWQFEWDEDALLAQAKARLCQGLGLRPQAQESRGQTCTALAVQDALTLGSRV